MYEAYYGFREKPFNLTPDPKFLYLSAKHLEAFAHLEFGLKQRGGFVMISGEVGMGKTTLCRYFLDRLDESTFSSLILYPSLSAIELFRAINQDLGINSQAATLKELVDELHKFLLSANSAGRNIVLVIDEAQNLDATVLEQVRLISNLETSTEKLIQIVLIGQTELIALLSQKNLRQLAQRITARYHLTPMSREETLHYIRHRLGVAGGVTRVSFTPGAVRQIHRFSRGIPRLINLVCDRALLAGYVLNKREIDASIIKRAVGDLKLKPMSGWRAWRWHRPWPLRASLAALFVGALALSFWAEANPLRLLGFPRASSSSGGALETATPKVPVDSPALPSPPVVAASSLDERVRTVGSLESLQGSTSRIFELWKLPPAPGSGLASVDELPSVAEAVTLRVSELYLRTEPVLALNLPAILELRHPSRPDSSYAALTRFDGAAVTLDFGDESPWVVPVAEIEKLWSRKAFVFWKDFEGLEAGGVAPYREGVWAQGLLSYLGHVPARASTVEVEDALCRFQDSLSLRASGVVDSPTRMALYSLSGRYPSPRLREPREP